MAASAVEDFIGLIDGKGVKGSMTSPKSPMNLIPPTFLRGIAGVLLHGMLKYAANNWMRGMKYSEVYAAIQRHLNAFWNREDIDPDSGLKHLYHAACGLVFLTYYADHAAYAEFDDRVFQ